MSYLTIFRLELAKPIVMLHFTTSNLSKCSISCKKNFFKFRTKFFLFGNFWTRTRKNYTLRYFTSAPSNFPKHKISSKKKILKFGTKIALTGYFGLDFQKTIVVFEISILAFVNMQRFIQKQTKEL